MFTPRRAAFGTFLITLHRTRGGFHHAASSPLRILPRSYENSCGCSHSKNPVTGKEDHGENLKFTNENELKKNNKYAPCRVEMFEQCNVIIKRDSKSRETIPTASYLILKLSKPLVVSSVADPDPELFGRFRIRTVGTRS
jgi:hypothetical protein